MLVGFLFAYYGKERSYYFTPNEVDAAQYLVDTAPPGSLIMDGTWNWPKQYKNYEFFSYLSLGDLSIPDQAHVVADPMNFIVQQMRQTNYPAAYFVITRSQKADVEMTGVLPTSLLTQIERALSKSEEFRLVYHNVDADIFELGNGADGGRP
jgi:hypothetical protein